MARFQPSTPAHLQSLRPSRAYGYEGDGKFDLFDAFKVIGVGTFLFVAVFTMAALKKD